MRQKEQLQRLAVRNPSLSLTVKRTAPQWQAAFDSVMSVSMFLPQAASIG